MEDHDHTDPPSDPALRVKAPESLLVEKGAIDPEVVGLVASEGLTSVEEMAQRKEGWRRAYLHTPHGKPVELKRGLGPTEPHGHEPVARSRADDEHGRAARPGPIAGEPFARLRDSKIFILSRCRID
jgi:hypothetical protein